MAKEVIATVGTFDGVHLGHRHLIQELDTLGRRSGRETLAITFSPHPAEILRPTEAPLLLNSQRERTNHLGRLTDRVETLVFSRDLSLLTAEEFMHHLQQCYGVRAMLIGYDHHFGRGGRLSREDYRAPGQRCGIEIYHSTGLTDATGLPISSTRIRTALLEGRVEEANALLGYTYELTGSVMGGMRLGRSMGYPTANLAPEDSRKLVPRDGVYATSIQIGAERYYGMLYIGKRPTINNGDYRTIEVNIFDINTDLYTQTLTLGLHRYIRGDQRFGSIDELKAQIALDEAEIRQFFSQQTP